MKMGLGMSLEQSPRLELGQRLELAQRFSGSIGNIRHETGDDPQDVLPTVIDRVVASVESDEIKKGLHQLFENGSLVSLLKERMDDFAVPTKEKIIKFVIEYIFKENDNGRFQEHIISKDGERTLGVPYKTSLTDLEIAYFNPDELKGRILKMEGIVKGGANVGGAMAEEIKEMRDAETIVTASRPEIELITNALTYVLVKKDKTGKPELSEFIKDAVILGKMTVVESDRLMKRFIKRCKDVGQKKRPEDMKEAFMNVVGEVTLITMGIIEQDMFTLNKTQIDQDVYEDARKSFSDVGLDIGNVFGQYKQRQEGAFFWNRWKIVDKKPSRVTDEKIRGFLTQTVREDEKDIFESIHYEDLIDKIKEINSSQDKDGIESEFQELFVDTFSSDEFQKTLGQLLKNKWYKKLEIFY